MHIQNYLSSIKCASVQLAGNSYLAIASQSISDISGGSLREYLTIMDIHDILVSGDIDGMKEIKKAMCLAVAFIVLISTTAAITEHISKCLRTIGTTEWNPTGQPNYQETLWS